MARKHVATASVIIDAPRAQIWRALTEPALIKQYLFETDVITDWKVGSPILYRGKWEGKDFEDKGQVVSVEPERRLVSTHWSPLSRLPDHPDNYHEVTYELSRVDGGTRVTIIQDNNATMEEKQHSEENWRTVLAGLKKIVEAM